MKNFFNEFKTFIQRGNVMDMAVGVVIGTAFSAIVTSLVNDIIMPLIATLLGNVSFTDLAITLKGEGETAILLRYGNFIQLIVNFLIIALVIFCVVKGLNNLKKKEEPAPEPAPAVDENLETLKEIRDLLKNKK